MAKGDRPRERRCAFELRFQLGFEGRNFGPQARSLIDLEQNGTFIVTLPEDEVRLSVLGGPPSYAVKSITYGGRDALGGLVRFSAADRQELLVTFAATSPSPWRRVSGRMVTASNAGVRPLRVSMTADFGITYRVPLSPDGSFEFPKVLPGLYRYVQAEPSLDLSSVTVRVTDKDVAGLEVPFALIFEVPARTVMADGSTLPDTGWFLDGTAAAATFKHPVRAGGHTIRFGAASSRYRTISATYGTVDLLREPLTLADTPSEEVLITLAPSPVSTTIGVTVSGRLTGAIPEVPEPRRVVIQADAEERIHAETDVRADGSFEFRNVPPSRYVIAPAGLSWAASEIARITVTDRDVKDVIVTAFRSTRVPAQVLMEDGSPLPAWVRPYFYSTRTWEPLGRDIPPNGRFEWIVSEDEQFLSVRNLPADYVVKSMTYGAIDLLKTSLTLDPAAPPSEIRITITRTGAQ